MKNDIGKKNMVFGFIYIITTLLLGLYLANKGQSQDPSWEDSPAHHILGAAHAHGNLESVLNILIGYLLCQLEASRGMISLASILLIVGALFHSGMLYLTGVGLGAAINLAVIGALSLVVVMPLMAYLVAVGYKK